MILTDTEGHRWRSKVTKIELTNGRISSTFTPTDIISGTQGGPTIQCATSNDTCSFDIGVLSRSKVKDVEVSAFSDCFLFVLHYVTWSKSLRYPSIFHFSLPAWAFGMKFCRSAQRNITIIIHTAIQLSSYRGIWALSTLISSESQGFCPPVKGLPNFTRNNPQSHLKFTLMVWIASRQKVLSGTGISKQKIPIEHLMMRNNHSISLDLIYNNRMGNLQNII